MWIFKDTFIQRSSRYNGNAWRPKLLVYLNGGKAEKAELRKEDPELFHYFDQVSTILQNHKVPNLPVEYVLMLRVCFLPECPHPVCRQGATAQSVTHWYEHGPLLSYIPFPVPDEEDHGAVLVLNVIFVLVIT